MDGLITFQRGYVEQRDHDPSFDTELPELHRRGRDILETIAGNFHILEESDASQWKALALARFHMLQALDRFVSFKEDMFLVPMLLEPNNDEKGSVLDLKRQNDKLIVDYDHFVQKWSLTSPHSINDEYTAEAQRMAVLIQSTIKDDIHVIERLVHDNDERT